MRLWDDMQAVTAHLNANPAFFGSERVAPAQGTDAVDNRRLAAAVKTLNEASVAGADREFSFAIDSKSKRPIVRIVDSSTHELIDQVPSEAILAIAQDLDSESASNNSGSGR